MSDYSGSPATSEPEPVEWRDGYYLSIADLDGHALLVYRMGRWRVFVDGIQRGRGQHRTLELAKQAAERVARAEGRS